MTEPVAYGFKNGLEIAGEQAVAEWKDTQRVKVKCPVPGCSLILHIGHIHRNGAMLNLRTSIRVSVGAHLCKVHGSLAARERSLLADKAVEGMECL